MSKRFKTCGKGDEGICFPPKDESWETIQDLEGPSLSLEALHTMDTLPTILDNQPDL